MSTLQDLAQAFLTRSRIKSGAQAAENAQNTVDTGNLERTARAALIMHQIAGNPALEAARIKLLEAQAEQAGAHGEYYRNPPTKVAAPGTLNPIYAPGTQEVVGFHSTKPGPDGNVQFYDRTGKPVVAEAPNSTPPSDSATPPPEVPSTFSTKPTAPKAPPKPERPIPVNTTDENGNPTTTFVTPDQARAMAAGGPGATPLAGGAGIRKPLTGDAESRRVTSQAILATVPVINDMLSDPEVQQDLGPLAGRLLQGEKWVGTMSPKMAKLYGAIHGFTMASYAAHGYRSAQDMERTMAQDLGPRFNAETLKGAIAGLAQFPQERVNLAKPGGGTPFPQPSAAPRRIKFDAQGNIIQ